MVTLDIPFSETELEQIRLSAALTDSTLQTYVRDAALAAADDRKRHAAHLSQTVARRSAELNARLA